MRITLAAAAVMLCFSTGALAAGASCEAQATDKKLAGAAKTSFMKKCEKDMAADAKKACETQAADKKLAGAAKNSFVTKCVKDAGGAAPAK
jgi:hypothetical protein